ncbi:MAG: acylase [Acidobacteriota bacterium]
MNRSKLGFLFCFSVILCLVPQSAFPQSRPVGGEHDRQLMYARNVTIVRDNWGIPHIHGKTDADAVFGMIYAQAEDDFYRVEGNYLDSLGRRAEVEGESKVYQDLRQKLFIDPVELKRLYGKSPAWLVSLMNAWADGLNFYLATHPNVKPRVITHFEPWMALSFTEGSIGGDIESISTAKLAAFYGDNSLRAEAKISPDGVMKEPSGSNGIAIAPSNTKNGNALLLINPHTTFFFRHEQQATSDEGLNAYGAITWGQFFIYQGFNDRLGWMHTSSGVDVIDEFAETIVKRGRRNFYRFGKELRAVQTSTVVVPYKAANGIAKKTVTVYRTHHGPIVRSENGKWISVALMNKPIEALEQSYLRTKARNFDEFKKALGLQANSSNNTIYADADGNIAYFHPQYVPRRDDQFDWRKPVNGSDPATEYRGLHALDELPFVKNPANGWIQNTNNWPYSAAGPNNSPKRSRFPKYMDTAGENVRGLHAMRVLTARKDFTLDRLRDAAYDTYLPAFAEMVPPLVRAYDALPRNDPAKEKLEGPIKELRGWDFRWDADSVETSLAVYYGQALNRRMADQKVNPSLYENDVPYLAAIKSMPPADLIAAFGSAVERLTADFGSWRAKWGEINRFQRLTGDIQQPFNDTRPSIPVPFPSGNWGSLASFGARTYPGTKRMYGTGGNSFVAVVEFTKTGPRARAVTAGGESGDPSSPHFNDQAQRYANGDLREVYLTPQQLNGHIERTYRPGE